VRAFIVELEHEPGSLAELAKAIGERGINITAISGLGWDDDGGVALITNDDEGTRALLEERNAEYRELGLVAAGLEDRPGSLGEAAGLLADRGVNIEALLPTGMQGGRVTVAFAVDDPVAAREALGSLAEAGASAV
jgi:hypothetical protein